MTKHSTDTTLNLKYQHRKWGRNYSMRLFWSYTGSQELTPTDCPTTLDAPPPDSENWTSEIIILSSSTIPHLVHTWLPRALSVSMSDAPQAGHVAGMIAFQRLQLLLCSMYYCQPKNLTLYWSIIHVYITNMYRIRGWTKTVLIFRKQIGWLQDQDMVLSLDLMQKPS